MRSPARLWLRRQRPSRRRKTMMTTPRKQFSSTRTRPLSPLVISPAPHPWASLSPRMGGPWRRGVRSPARLWLLRQRPSRRRKMMTTPGEFVFWAQIPPSPSTSCGTPDPPALTPRRAPRLPPLRASRPQHIRVPRPRERSALTRAGAAPSVRAKLGLAPTWGKLGPAQAGAKLDPTPTVAKLGPAPTVVFERKNLPAPARSCV